MKIGLRILLALLGLLAALPLAARAAESVLPQSVAHLHAAALFVLLTAIITVGYAWIKGLL